MFLAMQEAKFKMNPFLYGYLTGNPLKKVNYRITVLSH